MRNVIPQVFRYPAKQRNIPDFISLSDIPDNQRIKDSGNAVVPRILPAMQVRPRHASFGKVFPKCLVSIIEFKVFRKLG